MIPLVAQHVEAIRALCREYGVARLEVFGSATTGAFDPATSDVDYPPDYEFGIWLTRYFELKERLEPLLGRPVDLVMAGAIRKPWFIESVNGSRRLLYAARGKRTAAGHRRSGRIHRGRYGRHNLTHSSANGGRVKRSSETSKSSARP